MFTRCSKTDVQCMDVPSVQHEGIYLVSKVIEICNLVVVCLLCDLPLLVDPSIVIRCRTVNINFVFWKNPVKTRLMHYLLGHWMWHYNINNYYYYRLRIFYNKILHGKHVYVLICNFWVIWCFYCAFMLQWLPRISYSNSVCLWAGWF